MPVSSAARPVRASFKYLLCLLILCRVGQLEQELQAAATAHHQQQQAWQAAGVVTLILRRQSGVKSCRSCRARTPSWSLG
jgi:hypothetical protein